MVGRVAIRLRAVLLMMVGSGALARAESPFRVVPSLEVSGAVTTLAVVVEVPARHRLYAEEFRVRGLDATELGTPRLPSPVRRPDPLTGEIHPFYDATFTGRWDIARGGRGGIAVEIEWIGCDDIQCFLPERLEWRPPTAPPGSGRAPVEPTPEGFSLPPDFHIARAHAGMAGEREFLDFLAGRSGTDTTGRALLRRGWFVAVFLILGGGVLLNLTPCVLPMIPINLALIGAGASAASRGRGAALGALYGSGMCLAYGLLGVAVVLGGAPFGAINASPWFNAVIAVLFGVLAIAMVGRLNLDFSRWQNRIDGPALARRRAVGVFALGALAAVLAGACVAPVLVSVLLLSATLYQQGHAVALILPFLLGLGMALPWPLAGAGLARLPRPGPWMDRVKYGFAVFIAAMALYYARLAWLGFQGSSAAAAENDRWAEFSFTERAGPTDWAEVFERARASGRPVLVDVWASWCKSCAAMERTTLRRPAVREALRGFVSVKYAAERAGQDPARAVLRALGARGLPTYVILQRTADDGEPPRSPASGMRGAPAGGVDAHGRADVHSGSPGGLARFDTPSMMMP